MHVISQKCVREAQDAYPHSESALSGWYKTIKDSHFANFSELKAVFNSVDKVGDLYVFNIGGNKLRLIAAIHFNRQKVFVRHILTHTAYDLGKWKE